MHKGRRARHKPRVLAKWCVQNHGNVRKGEAKRLTSAIEKTERQAARVAIAEETAELFSENKRARIENTLKEIAERISGSSDPAEIARLRVEWAKWSDRLDAQEGH